MIDFDNPNTFPKELKNWGTEFEKMILRRVNTDSIEEWWQIEHQLQDIRIGESKLVYVFLAQGFEEIEALAVVDILRRAELEVKTVGVTGEIVGGSHGIVVACDTVEGVIDPSAAELIVLPGGIPGTLNLEKSAVVKEAIRSAMEDNRYIGAICAAPSILGHMGYLDDREITCYPGFESQMPKAYYTGEKVVVSDNIIMGKGAGAAVDFALKLVEVMVSPVRAKALRESLQC